MAAEAQLQQQFAQMGMQAHEQQQSEQAAEEITPDDDMAQEKMSTPFTPATHKGYTAGMYATDYASDRVNWQQKMWENTQARDYERYREFLAKLENIPGTSEVRIGGSTDHGVLFDFLSVIYPDSRGGDSIVCSTAVEIMKYHLQRQKKVAMFMRAGHH